MSRKNLLLSAAFASTAAFSAAASAGMMSPPPYSGMGATHQCWDFPTPSTPQPPDPGFINPFGVGGMVPVGPAMWTPAQANKNGVWNLGVDAAGVGGALDFRIPNHEDLVNSKEVTIEVKYFTGPPGTFFPAPIVTGLGFGAAGGPLSINSFSVRPADNNPEWTIGTWIGKFDHCPLFESIQISADPSSPVATSIDWVCISTNCIPTPGAASLLAAGGLIAGFRRRRVN